MVCMISHRQHKVSWPQLGYYADCYSLRTVALYSHHLLEPHVTLTLIKSHCISLRLIAYSLTHNILAKLVLATPSVQNRLTD